MELKEKRSVISRELKTLEPGSLYITISVPRSKSHQHYGLGSDVSYPTSLSEDLDLALYEVSCAKGIDREEFDWGVYFHRDYGNGTWYGLRRLSSTIDTGMDGTRGSSMSSMGTTNMGDGASVPCSLPFYTLSRQEMRLSPRLQTRVAALIRVLRVPDCFADGLTPYLDWLAVQTAPSAMRSFIWATSMYLRTRHHFSTYLNGTAGDVAATGFTTTGFLQEALDLAYKEVWYGLGGQLPRPMIASAFGVEIVLGEAKTANMQQQQNADQNADQDADQDADGESTQYLWGYIYQHAETGLYDTPWWSSITYTGVVVFEAISIDSSI